MASIDKEAVSRIPLLSVRASPRNKELWPERLKEELHALIQYVRLAKAKDQDWFTIKPNPEGTRFEGTCWYFYESIKYSFQFKFELPVGYPAVAPEIQIPELDAKTIKMYHGAKICLSVHFHPLWSRNVPKFGVAHALALGLAPWLAAEVPDLVKRGVILPKE